MLSISRPTYKVERCWWKSSSTKWVWQVHMLDTKLCLSSWSILHWHQLQESFIQSSRQNFSQLLNWQRNCIRLSDLMLNWGISACKFDVKITANNPNKNGIYYEQEREGWVCGIPILSFVKRVTTSVLPRSSEQNSAQCILDSPSAVWKDINDGTADSDLNLNFFSINSYNSTLYPL